MERETRAEREQAELAAREAAAVGSDPAGASERNGEPDDPALQPVREGGGGEAEGFEQAEEMLIERASHGDQQSAHAVLRDQGAEEEEALDGRADGEPDRERSSEREDEEPASEQ